MVGLALAVGGGCATPTLKLAPAIRSHSGEGPLFEHTTTTTTLGAGRAEIRLLDARSSTEPRGALAIPPWTMPGMGQILDLEVGAHHAGLLARALRYRLEPGARALRFDVTIRRGVVRWDAKSQHEQEAVEAILDVLVVDLATGQTIASGTSTSSGKLRERDADELRLHAMYGAAITHAFERFLTQHAATLRAAWAAPPREHGRPPKEPVSGRWVATASTTAAAPPRLVLLEHAANRRSEYAGYVPLEYAAYSKRWSEYAGHASIGLGGGYGWIAGQVGAVTMTFDTQLSWRAVGPLMLGGVTHFALALGRRDGVMTIGLGPTVSTVVPLGGTWRLVPRVDAIAGGFLMSGKQARVYDPPEAANDPQSVFAFASGVRASAALYDGRWRNGEGGLGVEPFFLAFYAPALDQWLLSAGLTFVVGGQS